MRRVNGRLSIRRRREAGWRGRLAVMAAQRDLVDVVYTLKQVVCITRSKG